MTDNLLLVYSLFFVTSLVFALVINRFLLKFSRNLGIRNTSETIIRWSSTSKPALGGISFYIIFLFSVIFVSFLIPNETDFFNLQTLGVIGVVTIGFLTGLFDDAYNTHPWIKFFSQLLCGIVLIVSGTSIAIFDSQLLNYAITIFWVVGMMNSINMLDNMDGITTIVSLSVVVTIFAGILLRGQLMDPIIVIVLGMIAVLLGFLYYNWHPSRMYMGDTGSQFLGVLLAVLGISFFWNGEGFSGDSTSLMRFLSVAIVFALPIIDTTTVFYKRIARGQSPFVGGKDHTTHHLSYLGLSDQKVALLFAALSLVSFFLAVSMTHFIHTWKVIHHVLFGSYFVVLFGFLFIVGNMNKDRSQ
ncbi:MAG: undecaprenyl/decaprenyl-phosphate alpha-N-acetylglucosaminyl 1-phosphate transferase [Bacteroidetes bacterium]|nr:MAG: undecaprenyl/decaprenyl-phosphate alpha-N-acetylglucosaminyl 1-phosphate transferase [Bacteroidota bacterium]